MSLSLFSDQDNAYPIGDSYKNPLVDTFFAESSLDDNKKCRKRVDF